MHIYRYQMKTRHHQPCQYVALHNHQLTHIDAWETHFLCRWVRRLWFQKFDSEKQEGSSTNFGELFGCCPRVQLVQVRDLYVRI